jgi:hypothetical protein
MVSKCANPECSERFLYLHQGKLFSLTPTPELESVGGGFAPLLYERFWLCDRCCKRMTLVWGGTGAKLISLPTGSITQPSTNSAKPEIKLECNSRAAKAGSHRH